MNALEMVGLDVNNREKVKNFSLGMRQRLAIAQVLRKERLDFLLKQVKQLRKVLKNLDISSQDGSLRKF